MDNTSKITNRQSLEFDELLMNKIPERVKVMGESTDDEKFSVRYECLPIIKSDAVEDSKGSLYLPMKVRCIVKNNLTLEEEEFNIHILNIPLYTNLGFKIKGTYYQNLDQGARAPGWSFVSDYKNEDGEDVETSYSKKAALLQGARQATLGLTYQTSSGIMIKKNFASGTTKRPINIFLRAITNYSDAQLVEMLGKDNPYIVKAFDGTYTTITTKRDGKVTDVTSKSDCINATVELVREAIKNKSNTVILPVAKQSELIYNRLFTKRYNEIGRVFSERLERQMSFSLRATGKEVAEDIVLNSKVLYRKGTVLTSEMTEDLDYRPIDSICVVGKNKRYTLAKFSNFRFRALDMRLFSDVIDSTGKKIASKDDILTKSRLDEINNSDVSEIFVADLRTGMRRSLKRRVRPTTMEPDDFLTVINIYANMLNGFDVVEDEFSLNNRVIISFTDIILNAVTASLNEFTHELFRGYNSKSSTAANKVDEKFLFEAISLPTPAALQRNRLLERSRNTGATATTLLGNENQMSDLNNALAFLEESYRVTSNINADAATDETRKVQDNQFGRIDSIDSPESQKVGLVSVRTVFSKATPDGRLLAPYLRVENGKVIDKEPIYLRSDEEYNKYIAEWNETFINEDGTPKNNVRALFNGDIVTVEVSKVTLKMYTQLQTFSPSHSLMVFPGNANGKRAVMATNHAKQAIATVKKPERPLVGTGCESIVDFGLVRARDILNDYYDELLLLTPEIKKYENQIKNSTIRIAEGGINEVGEVRDVFFVIDQAKSIKEEAVKKFDEEHEFSPNRIEKKLKELAVKYEEYWDKRDEENLAKIQKEQRELQSGELTMQYTGLAAIPVEFKVTTDYMKKTSDESIFTTRINTKTGCVFEPNDIVIYNISEDIDEKEPEKHLDFGGYKPNDSIFKVGYGIGRNLCVAYKTNESSSIDDAINISSRLVYDDTLTSISIKTFEKKLTSASGINYELGNTDFENYPDIGANGFPRLGTYLRPGDAWLITSKELKEKDRHGNAKKTNIEYLGAMDEGQVIRTEITEDTDGTELAIVWLASRCEVEVGDKLAGRCGNKGVIAKIVPEELMPYRADTGEVVDILLNPLGVPSRMNISQLEEVTLSYAMHLENKVCVISPYNKDGLKIVHDKMKEHDIKPVILMDGRTGLPFKRPVNFGYIYMQKLVHRAKRKIHAIPLCSRTDEIYGQPLKGSKNDGGQAIGEMESWCLQTRNALKVMQESATIQSDDVATRNVLASALKGLEQNVVNPEALKSGEIKGESRNDETLKVVLRLACTDIRSYGDGEYQIVPLTDQAIQGNQRTPISIQNLNSDLLSKDEWGYIDLQCEIVSPVMLSHSTLSNYLVVEVFRETSHDYKLELLTKEHVKAIINCEALVFEDTRCNPDDTDSGVFTTWRIAFGDEVQNDFRTRKSEGLEELEMGSNSLVYMFKHHKLDWTIRYLEMKIKELKGNPKSYGSYSYPDSTKQKLVTTKGSDLDKTLLILNNIRNLIDGGFDLTSFIISKYPVLPRRFRPLPIKSGMKDNKDDFDKSYENLLRHINSVQKSKAKPRQIRDLIVGIEGITGAYFLADESSEVKDKSTMKSKFTGSGSDHRGDIREKILKKRISASGRSVIVPASKRISSPLEIGISRAMLVRGFKEPLIGEIKRQFGMNFSRKGPNDSNWTCLLNSVGIRNRIQFAKFYNKSFKKYCHVIPEDPSSENLEADEAFDRMLNVVDTYLEGSFDLDGGVLKEPEIVKAGRQPTLHKFGILAFKVKVLDENVMEIHTLVCPGYNADFDGDQIWWSAQLTDATKKEAFEKMSAASTFINPKDGSAILVPQQDVALGLYCATMLKNNGISVYENVDDLKNVTVYSSLSQLWHDLDDEIIEYHQPVIYRISGEVSYIGDNGIDMKDRMYYSTAGRIIFNALLPDGKGFTFDEFTNPLCLPNPFANTLDFTGFYDLKYDGVVAAKGGTRKNVRYVKLSSVCEEMFQDQSYADNSWESRMKIIEGYQNIVSFGFYVCDKMAVTLSLYDVEFKMEPDLADAELQKQLKILDKHEEAIKAVEEDSEIKQKMLRRVSEIRHACEESAKIAKAGLTGGGEENDIRKQLLAKAEKKKQQIEKDYLAGLVSEKGRKDEIADLYSATKQKIQKSLTETLPRNNNFFIIYDSGSRGNISQVMQTAGVIGILQKSKTENMETPVTTNYLDGLSCFDYHIAEYSTRTGVSATQNETRDAGYATRITINMISGFKIVEEDCGKKTWWYDVQYGKAEDNVTFMPSKMMFNDYFVGRTVSYRDGEGKAIFGEARPESEPLTENCYDLLKNYNGGRGFSKIVFSDTDEIFEPTKRDLLGKEPLNDEVLRICRNFLKDGLLTTDCIKEIEKSHCMEVEVSRGVYRFYYELNSLMNTLLLGREAREEFTDVDGTTHKLKGLIEADWDDPEYPDDYYANAKHTVINAKYDGQAEKFDKPTSRVFVTTKKTIEDIRLNGYKRVPIRVLLDCHSKNGVCAHCYGLKYSNGKLPRIGEFLGTEAAQSMGEPAAQLTMNLINSGGVTGNDINSGVELFKSLLNGSIPGAGKKRSPEEGPLLAHLAEHSGYFKGVKLDSKVIGLLLPDEPGSEDCEMCNLCKVRRNGKQEYTVDYCELDKDNPEFGLCKCKMSDMIHKKCLAVKDGEYLNAGDRITTGYAHPSQVVMKEAQQPDVIDEFEETLRLKQVITLMNFYNTFKDNGINVMGRHFEILARVQNQMFKVVSNGNSEFVHVGQELEFGELLDLKEKDPCFDMMSFSNNIQTRMEVSSHVSGMLTAISFEDGMSQIGKAGSVAKHEKPKSLIDHTLVGNDFTDIDHPKIINQELAPESVSSNDHENVRLNESQIQFQRLQTKLTDDIKASKLSNEQAFEAANNMSADGTIGGNADIAPDTTDFMEIFDQINSSPSSLDMGNLINQFGGSTKVDTSSSIMDAFGKSDTEDNNETKDLELNNEAVEIDLDDSELDDILLGESLDLDIDESLDLDTKDDFDDFLESYDNQGEKPDIDEMDIFGEES